MTAQNKSASSLLVILAFAAVYLIWGSTYFVLLLALKGLPPFLLGTIRFISGGVLLLGWNLARGEKVFVPNTIKHAFVSGILMLFIGNGAVIWVEQWLPSAMVAIIVSSAPIWFVVLDKPLWGENFRSKSTVFGLIIGFAGVILLFWERIFNPGDEGTVQIGVSSMIFLLVGSISWAAGSLYSKYQVRGRSGVNTAWQMIGAGLAFIPGVLIRNEWQMVNRADLTTEVWLSVAYLVIFGSIVGFSAYVWLLNVRPATQVSTYAYVNPVVAVIIGVFFADESVSLLQILGLLTILGGVLLINLHKYSRKLKAQIVVT